MSAPATLDEWADRYGELQPAKSQWLNCWILIPVLGMSLFGLAWSVPLPAVLSAHQAVVNGASMLLVATFVYYCMLSIRIALVGLVVLIATAAPPIFLGLRGVSVLPISIAVFAAAFSWQVALTRQATGRAFVLRNLQYLMLGPLWLLRTVFRRAGLKY